VPDDNKVGKAGNGVPAPLLGGTLGTESGKQTSQDHDEVGNDGDQDVSAVETSQQAKVEKEEGCGDSPVNVAGPEDLAVDLGEGVGNVIVLVTDLDGVDGDTVAGGHGKV